MDYETLQDRVAAWLLELPDTTEALIGEWINEAIHYAERKYNFRYMEAEAAFVTTEDTRLLAAKPDRWKRTRGEPFMVFQDGGVFPFDWAPSESEMHRQYGEDSEMDDGEPQFLLEQPTELWCYPLPDTRSDYSDGLYRIRVPYWRYSDLLTDNDDTNWLTENAEQYIIYKATSLGMFFNRDNRAASYDQLAMREYKEAKKEDKRSKVPSRFNLSASRNAFGPSRYPRRRANRNRWRPS